MIAGPERVSVYLSSRLKRDTRRAQRLNHYRLKAGRFKLRLKVVLKTKPEILNNVIPANAGIQIQRHSPGFRIKACPGLEPGPGMT